MDPITLAMGVGVAGTATAASTAASGAIASGVAATGIGATLASGFMSAAGALFGGDASGKMYEYQAGIARQRSQVAEQNARWAVQAGEENALVSGMRTRTQVAGIRAGQGAGNIAPSSPSSTRVRAGQTEVGQIDESVIRTNAARRAYGYEVEGAAEAAQAGAYSSASATSRTASYYGAGASVLGAAGSVASKWIQAGQAGVPGFGTSVPASGLGGGDSVSDQAIY